MDRNTQLRAGITCSCIETKTQRRAPHNSQLTAGGKRPSKQGEAQGRFQRAKTHPCVSSKCHPSVIQTFQILFTFQKKSTVSRQVLQLHFNPGFWPGGNTHIDSLPLTRSDFLGLCWAGRVDILPIHMPVGVPVKLWWQTTINQQAGYLN